MARWPDGGRLNAVLVGKRPSQKAGRPDEAHDDQEEEDVARMHRRRKS